MIDKIGSWIRNPKRSLGRLWKRVRPMRRDYRARYRMRLRDWMLYHQHRVAFEKCHWMGVRTLKNPLDAWIMQEILAEVKPDWQRERYLVSYNPKGYLKRAA